MYTLIIDGEWVNQDGSRTSRFDEGKVRKYNSMIEAMRHADWHFDNLWLYAAAIIDWETGDTMCDMHNERLQEPSSVLCMAYN